MIWLSTVVHYTTVEASKEQADALYKKNLTPLYWVIGMVIKSTYIPYDGGIIDGLVTLYTLTGKKVVYQLRSGEPTYVEFTGFGAVKYQIPYPQTLHYEMYFFLKRYGKKAKDNFWKGGEI